MAASVNDYFQKLGGASSLVNTPKVTATRSAGGTTLTVDNCNWDQTTGKRFATFQVDTSGNVVDGTEIIWKGVVTSTTSIGSLARVAGASDTGNSIGDYVMLLPSSDWANQLMTGLLVEHNQDGTHGAVTATSVTATGQVQGSNLKLTTGKLLDTNGNETLITSATASAVNEITVTNAATGNAPTISATGGDTNIDLKGLPKGTGKAYGFMSVKIGTFTPSGTGNLSVTGIGYKPKLVKFTVLLTNTTGSIATGFGAMDASGNQYAHSINGQTGTVTMARVSSTTACFYLTQATSTSAAQSGAYVSMDSDGFTVNVTVNGGLTVAYEAWG